MQVIQGKSFNDVYKEAILTVLNNGEEVSPRGSTTHEISPATLVIDNPRLLLSMPEGRKGNYTFQLAEALWILRGSNDLEEIAHYNGVWRYFEDPDFPGVLNGAYGGRLRAYDGYMDQFKEVYDKLKADPYSRQAVMTIWDPILDNDKINENGTKYSKDIPCTNLFSFTIRNNELNMYVFMRSNDLHKGTIYDIPNFLIIQHVLAGWLDVEVGKYTHTANSLHIYQSDVENFTEILNGSFTSPYAENVEYDDLRLSMEDFNDTMIKISDIEKFTRLASYEDHKKHLIQVKKDIYSIENNWWKSVAAQLAMYNFRKVGATKEEFNEYLMFISNEYRKNVLDWKEIKKKG